MDNVLVGRIAGVTELGFYHRAYKLCLLPFNQIGWPFGRVAGPLLARTAAEPDGYRRAYTRLLQASAAPRALRRLARRAHGAQAFALKALELDCGGREAHLRAMKPETVSSRPTHFKRLEAHEVAAATPRFWSIQLLRIVAAYGVVVSHLLLSRSGGRSLLNGVDIFFLLSGFLAWTVTERASVRPWQFMAHRMGRIAPLYWTVIALQAALALLLPEAFGDVDGSSGNVALTALFLPHLDRFGRMWPLVTQGWTLNLDVFYYLIFALGLGAPRRWRLQMVTSALVMLTIVGLSVRPWHNGVVTWTYSNPLAIAFVAGLWIAEARIRGLLRSRRVGVVLIAAGALIYLHQSVAAPAYAGADVFIWISASACVLAGLLCLERSGVGLRLPGMRTLADWTYAIYLGHQLVRMASEAYLPHAFWVQALALVAGSTLLGKIGYDWVEAPINRSLRAAEARYAPTARRTGSTPISSTAVLKDLTP